MASLVWCLAATARAQGAPEPPQPPAPAGAASAPSAAPAPPSASPPTASPPSAPPGAPPGALPSASRGALPSAAQDPARIPTLLPPAPQTPGSGHQGSFEFGSYGRVSAATDFRGSTGRGTNIVAFGPRLIDEGSYAELELRREDRWGEHTKGRVVATVALFPPFFHFTGKPMDSIGVRNLYAQASYGKVTMWAGSRMYRGDDIYLLNWWPLDNQNTVGGGVFGTVDSSMGKTLLAFHVGQQRLDNLYQSQQIPVVAPYGFGTVNVTKLDRPRMVETLKLTQLFHNSDKAHFFASDGQGFKVSIYGEAHQLSAGVFLDPLTQKERGLPSDVGFLVGSQVTLFTGERDTHAHVFLRHARGIAAYDPLETPTTFALDRSTSGASDTRVAFSGNLEQGPVALAWGAYIRFFRDADTSPTSTQKYDEGAVVARPSVFFGEHFGLSVEGSYQQRRLQVIDPAKDAPISAQVGRLGVIPFFSPSGRGTFKRPQIRFIYALTARDSGARALYATEDVFSQRGIEHYAGLGAEWWFNSSSYP